MQRLWFLLYNYIAIPAFWLLLWLAYPFKSKIRRGIRGRRKLFERLDRQVRTLQASRRIWFHSSSMGEFEQAKPIIAALRKQYADLDIIVSFFSPSGYDHSKSYKPASLITYLPFDTRGNARRFLDLIQPTVAIMVRYDVWPNHLWELRKRGIPTFIANATLSRKSSRHSLLLKNFHRHLYNELTAILTVSDTDRQAFLDLGMDPEKLHTIGETRYDQVWQRSLDARTKHLIPEALLKGKRVFVAGSSWDEDDEVLIPAFRRLAGEDSRALMILVPHEPTVETLERIESVLNHHLRSIRFSELNDYTDENVIVVDSIGILTALYQYAHVTYVGGSFRQGIHSVLEPAVYGVPVLYGPKHQNSQEALELLRRGGSFVVLNPEDCYVHLRRLFDDEGVRARAGSIAGTLVQENLGATGRFMAFLAHSLGNGAQTPPLSKQ
ncbi:MAG: glycosyltransferase N-terminal domain-containing protein [Bacteroidota bacterium]